jgi:hypothetical protein
MMLTVMLWLNAHRTLVVVVVAVVLWTAPYYWYFRRHVQRWWGRGKAHDWSIDMVQKKAIFNGKEELR